MSYLVTGYVHKRHNGKGETYLHTNEKDSHNVYEIHPDEPSANRRAKELVETGPCLWATYELK